MTIQPKTIDRYENDELCNIVKVFKAFMVRYYLIRLNTSLERTPIFFIFDHWRTHEYTFSLEINLYFFQSDEANHIPGWTHFQSNFQSLTAILMSFSVKKRKFTSQSVNAVQSFVTVVNAFVCSAAHLIAQCKRFEQACN